MLPCNFGQVTGTIVSEINQRRPATKSDKPFTITEFKIKVQGASDDTPAIPFQAFNGIGDSIVEKYNQGDLVSLFYEPRNEVWDTPEGEKRSALRLLVTQIPTTVRRGEKSKAKLAASQQQTLAVQLDETPFGESTGDDLPVLKSQVNCLFLTTMPNIRPWCWPPNYTYDRVMYIPTRPANLVEYQEELIDAEGNVYWKTTDTTTINGASSVKEFREQMKDYYETCSCQKSQDYI